MSREQAETRLRQDIEHAWEPWFDRATVGQSQFSRAIRNSLSPTLIEQYKSAALVLLRQFVEEDSIDMDELDELADKEMGDLAKETASMVAETTAKWVEDDENPGRAFSRDRAELIAITEITRARTLGEMAAASLLNEIGIDLVSRWYTAQDERVCPVCGPLHKTPESYWSQFFPNGTPAHPRCRCEIQWKEKAKRASKRKNRVGRMQAPGPRPRFVRMRARSREQVEEYQVIRILEGGKGSGIKGHRTPKKPGVGRKPATAKAAPNAKPRAIATAAKQAAEKIEDSIRLLDHEQAHVLDENGKVVFALKGGKSTVTFTPQQLKKLKGKVMTHNHPGGLGFPEGSPGRLGSSFSREDIALTIGKELKEIRAVSPGYRHSMEIPEDFIAQEKKRFIETRPESVVKEFKTIAQTMGDGFAVWRYSVGPKVDQASGLSRKAFADVISKAKTPEEKAHLEGLAESNHWHNVWTAVSSEYGWNYSRTPWTQK